MGVATKSKGQVKKVPPSKRIAAPRKVSSKAADVVQRGVTIRMYNVGFGDAFLILIPDGKRHRRILVDCGSIEASEVGGPMKGIVRQIIADVTDEDGIPRIDVVVATHRHKDHVSGFADPAWNSVEVKEVWLPWTEHPTDLEARRIREIQSKLAFGLNTALAMVGTLDQSDKQLKVARDLVANALMLSNDSAMKTLHSGFLGSPERRFLPLVGKESRLIHSDALPKVKVHVLGPSRDPEIIRDMDPPKGESFLRIRSAFTENNAVSPAPFSPEFRLDKSTGGWVFPAIDQDEIGRAGALSELAVAVALDKAVNGTSLMILIDIAGTFFLFPGDAQWGTWARVLADDEWREMLQRVSFYKIGHHGSHNATPRKFVSDLLPMNCCAMASTLTRKIWPNIPRRQLLSGLLDRKAKIARSDKPEEIDHTFKVRDGVIEAFVAL